MRIALVAGESSGDILGAQLMQELRARHPDVEFEGILGPKMLAIGGTSHYPMDRLSVMGFVEALGRFMELIPIRNKMIKGWLRDPPDLFIGIDAPDFNLTLERRLRAGGIRTVHYVSPSVWAWRRYRIRKIARSVDHMLTLFPFEARFYERYNVPVTFVGHPLADEIPLESDRTEARAGLDLPLDKHIIAVLPGSRSSEVKYLGETLFQTCQWMLARRDDVHFVVPAATDTLRATLTEMRTRVLTTRATAMTLVTGQSHQAMAAADAVVLASGTATLEALLLKRPMVITYKAHPITFHIMKFLVGQHLNHIGLPNLLAGEEVAPEILQDDATPERLGEALLDQLESDGVRSDILSKFQAIHTELRRGATAQAADAIAVFLAAKQNPNQH
ncbi:MAG: lipid-A-disaccharide synthase [Pseudomonadota bacterium]